MRSSLPILLLLTTATARLGGQVSLPSATNPERHWSVTTGYESIASLSGGGKRLMNNNGDGMSMAVRRRVGESRWWLGLETEIWFVPANAAGVDSLAARSRVENIYTGNGADFSNVNLTISARYDAWKFGPVVGYGLAGAGINNFGGFVHGLCTHYPEPCEYPSVNVNTPGTGITGTVGGGLSVRVLPLEGIWRILVPSSIYAEARVTNQGTTDGRLTTTPLQFGFSW